MARGKLLVDHSVVAVYQDICRLPHTIALLFRDFLPETLMQKLVLLRASVLQRLRLGWVMRKTHAKVIKLFMAPATLLKLDWGKVKQFVTHDPDMTK